MGEWGGGGVGDTVVCVLLCSINGRSRTDAASVYKQSMPIALNFP